MSGTYKDIATTAIPDVTSVRFYEDTKEHVRTNHPEVPIDLPSIDTGVTNAVTTPTHVERSYGNSYVYVDARSTNSTGDPLRVPVKVVAGTSARVKSVYFASTPGGADVVWRRGL